MAVELTEDEMAHERRAEYRTQALLEDWGEFTLWLQEEFSVTNAAVIVHAYIAKGDAAMAGARITQMYHDYCQAKAFEETAE